MHLKSVEINGFKSFAEKTKIDFPKGIISIVGPNGSGKSNILDSVLWVLGEQSYKNIRARDSTDVIFSGGRGIKAKSTAEVSLIIDNEDRYLNIDFNEIKITRRIYMSGENEYLINNSKVRLKDVQELFLDTGIGKSAYSVIGQGKVEEILISTPRDLKAIIEEAAGIKRHKKRKEEAEKKLEEVDQNVEKIGYIEAEIESSLTPLRSQAETAKKYKLLKEEHRVKNVSVLKKELFVKENSSGVLQSKIEEQEKIILGLEEKFNNSEKELEEINLNRENSGKIIEELELAIERAKNIYQTIVSEDILSKERIRNSLKEKEEKTQMLQEYTEKYQNKGKKITDLQNENKSIKEKLEKEELIINKVTKEIEEFEKMKKNSEIEVKKLKDAIMSAEIEKIKSINEKENNERNTKTIVDRLNKVQKEILEIEKTELQVLEEIQKITETTNKEKLNEESLIKNKTDLEFEKKEKEKEIEEIKKEINSLQTKSQHFKMKKEVLVNSENNHEGFFKGVKELLNEKMEGIVGPLISIVKISENLETAIESSVGNSLQDIVVLNSDVAKKCIEVLKQKKSGRASFLPLDTIKVYDNNNIPSGKGILGLASELIEYDKKYEKAVKFVFGNTLVVEDIDTGIDVSKKGKFSGNIVSLDGELISGRGKITGGEKVKGTASIIFERKRELKKIEEEIEELMKLIDKLSEKLEEYYKQVAQINNQVQNCEERIASSKNVQKSFEYDKELKIRKMKEISNTKEVFKYEKNEESLRLEEINSKISAFEKLKNELDNKISNLSNLVKENENTILNSEMEIEKADKNFSENRFEFVKIKEKFSMITEKLTEEQEDYEYLDKNIVALKDKLDKIEVEFAEISDRIKTLELEIGKKDEEIKIENEKLKIEKEKYRQIEMQEKSKILELKDVENKIIMDKNNFTKISRDSEKILTEIIEIQHKLEEIGNTEEIEPTEDESATKKEIIILDKKIAELGEVNLLAIEECERLSTKYEFIISQKNDLQESQKSLRTLIKEIEIDIIAKFSEAFEEIRNNFIYTCEEVLNSAQGNIILNDPENVLETGAELEVKFRNKKSQTLTLLSGGEKSMVAVAFIMAIFMYRPSPFTFFDEIEAALDESNTEKLIRLLKHFTDDSQFILITHNKKTMRESDVLYGVTMNKEEGVSKIVSVTM